MKKLFFLVFLCLGAQVLAAQVRVHTDMRTPTWNVIGLRYDAEIAPGKWGSVFPPALKALNNKVIELPGYIIPTKVGSKFSEFMFSIVPIASLSLLWLGRYSGNGAGKNVNSHSHYRKSNQTQGNFHY